MMGKIPLSQAQIDAVNHMQNGCILCGAVGSGKSRTALAYYYICNGGNLMTGCKMKNPKDLYIITTARKRDTFEWEAEFWMHFLKFWIQPLRRWIQSLHDWIQNGF